MAAKNNPVKITHTNSPRNDHQMSLSIHFGHLPKEKRRKKTKNHWQSLFAFVSSVIFKVADCRNWKLFSPLFFFLFFIHLQEHPVQLLFLRGSTRLCADPVHLLWHRGNSAVSDTTRMMIMIITSGFHCWRGIYFVVVVFLCWPEPAYCEFFPTRFWNT